MEFIKGNGTPSTKTWRPETIFKLANKTGWEIINYFGFLTFAEPNLDTERWQFVARKITI